MREVGENDHGVTANSKKKNTSQVSIYSELKVTSELRDTRQGHLTPWQGSSSCLCPAASPQPPRSLLRARGSCAEAVGRRSSSSLAFSEAPEVHARLHHPDSATCAFSPHGLCMGWELTGKAPSVDRVRHRQYRTLNSSHAGEGAVLARGECSKAAPSEALEPLPGAAGRAEPAPRACRQTALRPCWAPREGRPCSAPGFTASTRHPFPMAGGRMEGREEGGGGLALVCRGLTRWFLGVSLNEL